MLCISIFSIYGINDISKWANNALDMFLLEVMDLPLSSSMLISSKIQLTSTGLDTAERLRVFICNFSVRYYYTRWWYEKENWWSCFLILFTLSIYFFIFCIISSFLITYCINLVISLFLLTISNSSVILELRSSVRLEDSKLVSFLALFSYLSFSYFSTLFFLFFFLFWT